MNKEIARKKFNVTLLGESDVGKTRMTNTYFGKLSENDNIISTIGIESTIDKATFDGIQYKFKIYDTAGQERYKSISRSAIKINDGFLLVFSVDNRKSFELIDDWLKSIIQEVDIKKKIIFLVGNKIDLNNREVTNEEAVSYASMKNIKYFETSALTGFGIKEVFKQLYQDIYDLFKASRPNMENNNNIVLGKDQKTKKKKCC